MIERNKSIMKTFFTIAFIAAFLNTSLLASTPENGAEYYICHFTQKISKSYLNELSNKGINIFKADSDKNLVYVTVINNHAFTTEIKSNMSQLVKVDKNGNKTVIVEKKKNSNPQLLNLFFNFI